VVQVDRRKKTVIDEDAVRARYGIGPKSIPDYLALVGDSADGFPGLRGWGAKTASAVLAVYGHIEAIPDSAADWEVGVRGAGSLAATLAANRDLVALFKDLATLRTDPPVMKRVEELRWRGPGPGFTRMCETVLEQPSLLARVEKLAAR
jgi:5'-3' exonuclease